LKLGIGFLLAAMAALINYYVNRPQEVEKFPIGIASKEINKGDVFRWVAGSEDNNIRFIELPSEGIKTNAEKILLTGDNRVAVLGARASRSFALGDVILLQDRAVELPNRRQLGPFRLISVGNQLTGTSGGRSGGSSNTITVAIELDSTTDEFGEPLFEKKARHLLEILANRKSKARHTKIIAIEIFPDDAMEINQPELDSLGELSSLPISGNERAVIVPLDNVTTLQAPLLIGQNIGFILSD